MIEAKDILPLIGIPGLKISHLDVDNDESNPILYLELHDIRGRCPKCGSDSIEIKDYYFVTLNNSIIKHRNLKISLRVRRYKCKRCGKTFKQEHGLSNHNCSITNAVKNAIIEDLKEPLTITQIAKDHNVSLMTVNRILSLPHLEQHRLPLSEIICIDEFCFKHSNSKEGKYPAVITDPLTGTILDITYSRWKTILFEYFNKVKFYEKNKVKYFVSDMNETYRQIKKAFFKDAIHIADRFHVIKAFNDAITSIRTKIIKEERFFDDKAARFLKKNWKIFLMDRNKLKAKRKVNRWGIVTDPTVDIDECLSKYPELHFAYWVKEEFNQRTKKLMYFKEAESIVCFFENQLSKSTITEMNKIGKTLRNWRLEIINGMTFNPYNKRISNAIAESMNNQIQTLINICYGIPKFENMRQRVLYINRNKRNEKD